MSRRTLLSLAAGALAPLTAACSPLTLMETLAPRDRGARRIVTDLAYGAHARQKLDLVRRFAQHRVRARSGGEMARRPTGARE